MKTYKYNINGNDYEVAVEGIEKLRGYRDGKR